jgi:predicted GNAT family N-acyltransferase
MSKRRFYTRRVSWQEAKDTLTRIRYQVFVNEQRVPADMELDEHDTSCDHLLAFDEQGIAVGTARLLPDGHIGRMAVLAEYRGQGIGTLLLTEILELAKSRGLSTIALHAQTHAVSFYEKHLFYIVGEEFMEAGIPHVQMQRRL